MIRKFLYIIFTILPCLLFWHCENSDDLSEIFLNKRFKITNVVYNKTPIANINELYKNDSYYIIFNSNTFQGTLMSGVHIEGTWNADGKNNSIQMRLSNNLNILQNNDIQEKVLDIIKNANHYSGDCNVLKIKKDNDSYIQMSSMTLNQ